ncbi:MAG: hypothetical protein ACRCXC_00510 [Legionella sp.]
MLTIKTIQRMILVLGLIGATVLASSCSTMNSASPSQERGYGGEGGGLGGGGGR